MRKIRDANNLVSSTAGRIGSGSRSITGSLVVVLIISLCVLVVGIIS